MDSSASTSSASTPREFEKIIEEAEALAAQSEDLGSAYSYLATRFYIRYTSSITPALPFLNAAIDFAQRGIDQTLDGNANLAIRLDHMSSFLHEKYVLGGGDDLLTLAISYGRRATQVEVHSTRDFEDRADFYANLTGLLLTLYQLKGGSDTIDEALRSVRIAAKECSEDNKATHLNTLANALSEKYQNSPKLEHAILCEALEAIQQATSLEPKRAGFWNTEASLRTLSYEYANQNDHQKRDEDLRMAMSCAERAFKLAHDNSEDREKLLIIKNMFCKILNDNYSRYGRLQDLERSIELGRSVMAETNSTYPHLVRRSQVLSNALSQLFEREGDIRKLEEAIQISVEVMETLAFKNATAEQGMHYHNAALKSLAHFGYTNSRTSISEAVEYAALAVQVSQVKQEKAHCSVTLAATYSSRSEIVGSESDIDEAIRILASVKNDVAPAHKWRVFDFLARAYAQKSRRSNDLDLLDSAINEQSRALHIPSEGALRRELLIHASFLRGVRQWYVRDSTSLNAAIAQVKELLKLLERNHPNRPSVLRHLGELYGKAYEASGDGTQLDLALGILEEARKLAPDGHITQAAILNTLGTLLSQQYTRTEDFQFMSDAVTSFRKAFQSVASSATERIRGGRAGGLLLVANSAWNEAVSLLEDTIKLLPQLTPRELDREDQQFYLTNLSDLSGLAASAALNAGWSAADALSLFEAGRALIAGGSADLRTDLLELEAKAPNLAREYSDLRHDLRSHEPVLASLENMDSQSLRIENSASQRLRIAKNLSDIEERIRKVPGFEHFKQVQLTPSKNLVESDQRAVVAFNITEIRSDAFLVTKGSTEVMTLPELGLPRLKEISKAFVGPDRLTEGGLSTFHKRNSQLREHLGWLWDTAVKPVLKRLGFLSATSPLTLPRITWISSGILGIMPLHAAGRSWANSENTAFHVISSYAPTLRALRLSQEKLPKVDGLGKVLILTMPTTSGYRDLNVEEEAKGVEQRAIAMGSQVEIVQYPSRQKALQLFDEFSTIFLGCHGETDPANPSNSGILLADGPGSQPDKLTVRDIAAKALTNALLVYLSACSTAENPSQGLMDEVIHLASTLQTAGFPHVIGTMWQVEDDIAGHTARLFFDNIMQQAADEAQGSLDFALALHQATKDVREGRAYGEGWGKNARGNVTTWAPFVHIGY